MDTDTLDAALARARTRHRLPAPSTRRALRERAGLSQQDIATALKVTREAVAMWEAGKRSPRRPALLEAYLYILERCAAAPLT
jgi:DNA-binding transcriptional regulator YiaG